MDCHEIKPGIYRVTHKRRWWEGKAVNADDAKRRAMKRFTERESNGKALVVDLEAARRLR